MITEKADKHDAAAMQIALQEIQPREPAGRALGGASLELIKDIKVCVTVTVGRAQLTVAELFALKDDSVIELEASTDDPVELMLEGRLVARGTLVAVGDRFGVSITEILPGAER